MDTPALLTSNNHFLGSLSDIMIVGQQASADGGNAHPSQGGFIASSADTPFHSTMANGHISTFILPERDVPQRNDMHNRAYIQSPHQNTQRVPLSESQPPVTSFPTSYNNISFIPSSFQNQQHCLQQQHDFQLILQVPFQQYSLPTAQIFHPSHNAYPIPSFPINCSQPQTQLNPPHYVFTHTPSHFLRCPLLLFRYPVLIISRFLRISLIFSLGMMLLPPCFEPADSLVIF